MTKNVVKIITLLFNSQQIYKMLSLDAREILNFFGNLNCGYEAHSEEHNYFRRRLEKFY